MSLYRKYRPQTFAEVVGQDHVTRTLANAIEEDRLHHAYLFCGPRGTGKTSTARILAKSINCVDGPTPTPCNTCTQCTEITNGSSVDVIELDMASHGGVDDARDLRDKALFAPASARKKVYILDEVHMASTAAFNALLKLIEEPPSHVVFTMATTDPQKVIPTIMSRVQRLDLRRINAEQLGAHLRNLVHQEGRTIDDAALDGVVRAGDGSARDALSVLEQVLSYTDGPDVVGEDVEAVLGSTDAADTAGIVSAVAAGDLADALGRVQSLLDDGRDLRRFAFDLLQHLRDLLVLQVAPERPDLVDATADRMTVLREQAATVPADLLVQAVQELATAVTEMRLGPPRLPLELVLAKLTVGRGNLVAAGPATESAPTPEATPAPGLAAVPEPDPEPTPEEPEPEPEPEPASEPEPAASALTAVPDLPEPAPAEPEPEPEPDVAESDEVEDPPVSAAERALANASAPPPAMATPARPPGPEAVVEPPPPSPSDEDLAKVQQRWDAVLEDLKESGMRVKAIFEPARPVKLRNGVLTLRYSTRYGSFHAENAGRAEYADALTAAVQTTCGIRVKVQTLVEGNDPPVSTPGTTNAPASPATEARAQVREAEAVAATAPLDPVEAQRKAVALLVEELGAEEITE